VIICAVLREKLRTAWLKGLKRKSVRSLTNILITGGAGFIGSNFIRFILEECADFKGRVINFDALTYAGRTENLDDIKQRFGGSRYFFEHSDIRSEAAVESVISAYNIDTIVHFAAESHVDRSISGPRDFIETNVLGTWTLLDAARRAWADADGKMREDTLFHHISTDEVYGSLGSDGFFTETTPYSPRSPYSASKAASDHLVMAYHHTYGLPVTLSNCSNNFGPFQFPEKLIPVIILNILAGKALPVYGDGKNIRDWIYVDNHNSALWRILRAGKTGEKYNIGGETELDNLSLVNSLISVVTQKAKMDAEAARKTISFVRDRPGHDRRYAIDCSKIKRELGWKPHISFEEGLEKTVEWYISRARCGVKPVSA
jgi:dTDP-glucose 4,6-dehydratase